MTKEIIKDLMHSASVVGHQIAESLSNAAHEITQNIADIQRDTGQKIENILKEKGIVVNVENRHSGECHNIIINSDGTFFTNNSSDFSRGLLNQVLFLEDGEERLSKAMSRNKITLTKIQNPQQKIIAKKATQLFQTNNL